MNIIYLNGEFVPRDQAKVSVFDRGFLFGDSIYEVIPVFDGLMFQADEHLQRLNKSLEAIQIPVTLTPAEWKNIFRELLERNQLDQQTVTIYLQVTRGADKERAHGFPDKMNPTIVAFCSPAKVHSRAEIAEGYAAITAEDTRRRDCYIKSNSLLPAILLYQQAKNANAVEAILIRNGEVTEGTLSNVFIVKNSQLFTPPVSPHILNGVTRQLIIQLAKRNNIPCHEEKITEDMLKNADEIWVTGSSKEICPIVSLNERPVGNGKAGPVWARMKDYYDDYKKYEG